MPLENKSLLHHDTNDSLFCTEESPFVQETLRNGDNALCNIDTTFASFRRRYLIENFKPQRHSSRRRVALRIGIPVAVLIASAIFLGFSGIVTKLSSKEGIAIYDEDFNDQESTLTISDASK